MWKSDRSRFPLPKVSSRFDMKKKIAVFGSTGSIGTQTLDVIRDHPKNFSVSVLTANQNATLLIEQAREFQPQQVVIADESRLSVVREALKDLPISVHTGRDALCEVACYPETDIVLMALVGYSGLHPTYHAIKAGKTIALANKETMVVAGAIITHMAQLHGVKILPVDSEHSAIYQCLMGERSAVEKILLTASGGPFLDLSEEDLKHVSPQAALKHPNWNMGAKVTIDSASLMNKGFEMIEACWFFQIPPSKIEVLVHPQSIVHSMVQFADGSVKAQLGQPDMRLPISFALGEEVRLNNRSPRLDFTTLSLTFQHPDTRRFPNLDLAYRAMNEGYNHPCALNAANEVAVNAFLQKQIAFTDIHRINECILEKTPVIKDESLSLDALFATDDECRKVARQLVHQYSL